MAFKTFASNLTRLSKDIADISCLTEDDRVTNNKDLALLLIYYRPIETKSSDRIIRVHASWTTSPADVVSTCNNDSPLHVNIAKNMTYYDGIGIEKNQSFRQLMNSDLKRKHREKKVLDIGEFRQAFLFIAYEGNFRGSSQSISSDDGENPNYPGYQIKGPVLVLPENGVALQGWYKVEILNLLTNSVILRLQARPETTVFKVLEQAQLAKQCSFLIKSGSRYVPLDATMDQVYEKFGKVEDGTRVVGLIVETARSGPDLLEKDQEESDQEESDGEESDEEDQEEEDQEEPDEGE